MPEVLRPRGVPEGAIPFPEALGYWGFRVEKRGVETRLVWAPWCWAAVGDVAEPWPCTSGPRSPTSGYEICVEERPSPSSPCQAFFREVPAAPATR